MHQTLICERPLLDSILVLDLPGARLEAPLPEAIEPAHPLERVLASPALFLDPVDGVECRLRSYQARSQLLASLLGAVLLNSQHADEYGQRQSLPDDRHEDQREGHEQDEVAVRERGACMRLERKRKGSRERNRSAHSRPRSDNTQAPADAARALLGATVEQANHIRNREHPQEARPDHGGA